MNDKATVNFDEIDRVLRPFAARTKQEQLDAIAACPAHYSEFTKNQRQQILMHLSIRSSVFEHDEDIEQAASESLSKVIAQENAGLPDA